MRRAWIAIAVLGVGALAALWVFGSSSIACGAVTVRVTGRLLDAETGAPLVGAYLMSLPERDWAQEETTLNMYRHINEELRALAPSERARNSYFLSALLADGWTDDRGGFVLYVKCPISYSYISGIRVSSQLPGPGDGVEALLVRRTAQEDRVLVDVSGGSWKRTPDDPLYWARWDLGDIRVPRAK